MPDIIDIKSQAQIAMEAEMEKPDVRDLEFWLPGAPDVPLDQVRKFNTPPHGDEEYDSYARAADIAHNMAATIPARVRAANADPVDTAYALWVMTTGILLQAGWSACDLAETAHEMQSEYGDDDEEEGPEEGEEIGRAHV